MNLSPYKTAVSFWCLCLVFASGLSAQQTKRSLEDLINIKEPGWTHVKTWMDTAKNTVEVLPVNEQQAREKLYEIQVTTRSPMGAIIFNSGGILVDHGWIRIPGSGQDRMKRTIFSWNKDKTLAAGDEAGFLFVADDAAGGYFATEELIKKIEVTQ